MTNPKKEQTKQVLEATLAQLLEKQSFDDTSTTQLAAAAKISRSGFYTHYRDKYELIERYQQRLFNQLEYIFDKHTDNSQGAVLEIFEFLNREPLFAALLSRNGSRDIQDYIKNKFKRLMLNDIQDTDRALSRGFRHNLQEKKLFPSEIEYGAVFLVNALFGVCQRWIEGGKKESPQQITDVIFKMMT